MQFTIKMLKFTDYIVLLAGEKKQLEKVLNFRDAIFLSNYNMKVNKRNPTYWSVAKTDEKNRWILILILKNLMRSRNFVTWEVNDNGWKTKTLYKM